MNKYRAEVYRCTEWKAWAVAKYDADDNLVGDSEWWHNKQQALYEADQMLSYDEVSEVRVFNARGELQKTITVNNA